MSETECRSVAAEPDILCAEAPAWREKGERGSRVGVVCEERNIWVGASTTAPFTPRWAPCAAHRKCPRVGGTSALLFSSLS